MTGDAFIPSLRPYNLDRVPGYRLNAEGHEDESWRDEYFSWAKEALEHRIWVQERCDHDLAFRAEHLKLCKKDPAYFILCWLYVEEPRGLDDPTDSGTLEEWETYLSADIAPDADLDLAELTDVEYAAYAAAKNEEWLAERRDEPEDDTILLPFIPFAYQVQLIQLFQKVNSTTYQLDVYISKARGVGVSYTILAAGYWAWLFTRWRGIYLSDKLERADRSFDLSSMFGKVDLFFYYTPKWMRPKGFNQKNQKHRQQGMWKNPENGIGQMTAVATTPAAGRGDRGRYSASDESAFQEHYSATHATLGGTVKHRWSWSSESYEKGRQWQNAWQSALKMEKEYRDRGLRPKAIVVELNWWDNPYQGQKWKESELERYRAAGQEDQFAVEYLRNPDAGYSTFIYPTVRSCVDTDGWWMPERPLFMSVDPAAEDDVAWVFWQTYFENGNKRIRWLDCIVRDKMPAEFWAHVITGIEPEPNDLMWPYEHMFGRKEHYFMDWLRQVPPASIRAYGDPAVATVTNGVLKHLPNSFTARFFQETLKLRTRAKVGDPPIPITIMYKELHRRNRHNDRRTAMREALTYSEFSRTDGAQELKEAIASVRLQEETEKTVSPPGWIHDRFTHPTSAAEFGMVYETMQLTPGEVQPKRMETIKRPLPRTHKTGRKGHQSPFSRDARQGRSLVGV
jgi:hypothetical protein